MKKVQAWSAPIMDLMDPILGQGPAEHGPDQPSESEHLQNLVISNSRKICSTYHETNQKKLSQLLYMPVRRSAGRGRHGNMIMLQISALAFVSR